MVLKVNSVYISFYIMNCNLIQSWLNTFWNPRVLILHTKHQWQLKMLSIAEACNSCTVLENFVDSAVQRSRVKLQKAACCRPWSGCEYLLLATYCKQWVEQ